MSTLQQLKKALSAIHRQRRFVFRSDASAFAAELEMLLDEAKQNISDPREGVEFTADFFRCDNAVFMHCDDSDGIIGDVFRIQARDLFAHFALQCDDREWVAEQLLDLQHGDDYGVRDATMESASLFLSEGHIRSLIARLWGLADIELEEFAKRHWLHLIESLARQIHDAPLYEKAALISWPLKNTATCIRIAEVYRESGDARKALEWLERVPLNDTFMEDERDRLLLAVHSALGNRAAAAEIAWRIFRRCRHTETFALLVETLAPVDREQLIADEILLIIQSATLSYSDVEFLISLDRIQEASAYVLKHADGLNGDYYSELLSLAEPLEECGMYLAATMLYRALLESILARAVSKYYTYGVRYLRKLDALATHVTEWERFVPHGTYHLNLLEQHARKSSFWARYTTPEGRRYRKQRPTSDL